MKKRLNLKELELQLPAIDERNTKILLGGSDYSILDECAGIGCGGQLIKDHVLTNEHNDYGDNFDLDASIDGFHDYDGSNDADGGSSSTGGTSTGVNISLPSSLSDGIRNDSINITVNFSQSTSTEFNTQFNGVLASNSVIANLLNSATQDNHYVNIEFGNINTAGVLGATSTHFTLGGQTITLDTSLISASGMIDYNGIDNINIDHSNLTPEESLVVMVAHEAFHAYSNLGFYMSQQNGNTYEARMNWMLDNGFSQDIVNIYYNVSVVNGVQVVTLNDPNDFAQNEHNYMTSNSFTFVNDALAEYQSDRAQALETLQSIESALAQAESYLGSGGDPAEGQPSNEYFQNSYDQILHGLENFMHQYGWLVNP